MPGAGFVLGAAPLAGECPFGTPVFRVYACDPVHPVCVRAHVGQRIDKLLRTKAALKRLSHDNCDERNPGFRRERPHLLEPSRRPKSRNWFGGVVVAILEGPFSFWV